MAWYSVWMYFVLLYPIAFRVKILQYVQCLQHHGALRPLLQLINLNSLVVDHQRRFLHRFP